MNAWETIPKTIEAIEEIHAQIAQGKLYEILAKNPILGQAIDGRQEIVQFNYFDSPLLTYNLFPMYRGEEMDWDDHDLDLETACLVTREKSIPNTPILEYYGKNSDFNSKLPQTLKELITLDNANQEILEIYRGAIIVPLANDIEYRCNLTPSIRRIDERQYNIRTNILVDHAINAKPYTEQSNVHIIEQGKYDEEILHHYWLAHEAKLPSNMTVLIHPYIENESRDETLKNIELLEESGEKPEITRKARALWESTHDIFASKPINFPKPKLISTDTFGMQEDGTLVPVSLSKGDINHYF